MKFFSDNSWLQWALLTALALSAEPGACQNVVLLRAVSVSRNTILLSDLLPSHASGMVRNAADRIELGRAPQCHAVRIFEPSNIEKMILTSPALRRLTAPGPISVERACFAIPREAVQRAVSEFMRQKTGDADAIEPTVRWAGSIYALQESPALEVEQAIPDHVRSELQICLRCVERANCSSFWVAVPSTQPRHFLSAAAPAPRRTLVKVGQRAMLILEDPPMRIQLWVTCLQRGSLGKQVRAMDPSTHRVFQAQVTGAGTLVAHL